MNDNGRIIELLTAMKESLEREIQTGFAEMRARFDTQSARMDRHAGQLQAGLRWTTRWDQWTEKIDTAMEAKDREIAELKIRLDKLERERGQ